MLHPSPYRLVIENTFRVVDRVGAAIDFKLNEQQADLDANWSRRNLVTKIRQHAGISTLVIGRYVAKCLGEQNRRCVIVSAEADATARLLQRARFIVNNLRLPPGVKRPSIGTDNMKALSFQETGSTFWIGTAGSRNFGRGDTITDLHLSEAAFYADAENTVSGLFPAAELGEITVESTGNGRGNWFHRQAVRARNGSGFKLFFYSWVGLDTCAISLNQEQAERIVETLDPDLEEPELFDIGVSPQQLAWRRERIFTDYDGDLIKFKENYPRTFDECFQSTGFSFFPVVKHERVARWVQESKALWCLEGHPRHEYGYVAGIDVGGGIGRDNSVIQIFCLDTREQVAEWVANDIAPDELGHIAHGLGRRFNWAYINPERNNHGLTTISVLVGSYPLDRLHRGTTSGQPPSQVILSQLNNFGTYTSETTRGLLLGTGRRLLSSEYTIHSETLRSELDTFVESKTGKYEADAGCFDDRVFAALHALICVERATIATAQPPAVNENTPSDNPFSWEYIFEGTKKRSTRYGIAEKFS
jgi:hypothetical protein